MYEKFVVYTHHTALSWLLSIQRPSGRLLRWGIRLAELDFELAYKNRKANVHANALSRFETLAETITDDDVDIPSFRSEKEETFKLSHVSDEMNEDAIGLYRRRRQRTERI